MKRIILTVTNDLVTDRRVHKVCTSLTEAGYDVTLIGRRRRNSLPLGKRVYRTRRIRLLFNKKFLFYAFFNFRIFLILLFSKADILVANDLDTLPANWLVSKVTGKKLVYDSHEYFTEVPELIGRERVKRIWLFLERKMLPGIKHAYTVCGSLARIYNEKYGIEMKVVRNVPYRAADSIVAELPEQIKGKRVILYQGSLNTGRGIEQVIEAIQYVEDAVFLIIGDGDIAAELQDMVKRRGFQNKIVFTGKIPFEKLAGYTRQADVGIAMEEDRGLNYHYSLSNKLFDYIRAGVPVLAGDLPETAAVVRGEDIGMVVEHRDPVRLVKTLTEMISNETLRKKWKHNLEKAAEKYCWEKEEETLLEVFRMASVE